MTDTESIPDPDGSERFSERDAEIWRDRVRYSMSTPQLARKHGISQQRVSQILTRMREAIPVDTREQAIVETDHLYRDLINEAMEIADLTPPPVTAGKDGMILTDPETGKIVRDYGGRLRALETVGRLAAERRKLFGLDAAVKVDMSVTDEQAARRAAEDARKRLEGAEDGTPGTEPSAD